MTDKHKRYNTWWMTILGLISLASATILSSSESVDATPTASAWVLFVFGIALMIAGGLSRGRQRGEGH